VNFLVDAQLPIALARWLSSKGLEARHVFTWAWTMLQTPRSGIERRKKR